MTTEPDQRPANPPARMPLRTRTFLDEAARLGWETSVKRHATSNGPVTVTATAVHPTGSPSLRLTCIGGQRPHRRRGMDWRVHFAGVLFASSANWQTLQGFEALMGALTFHSKARPAARPSAAG